MLDASSIRLTWEPVVLQHWEVDHYTIYYTVFSTTTTKTVHQETVPTPSSKISEVFYLTHLDPKFEHWFQVTVSIEVEGEEFESQRPNPLIFNFGIYTCVNIASVLLTYSVSPLQMLVTFSYTCHQLITVPYGK